MTKKTKKEQTTKKGSKEEESTTPSTTPVTDKSETPQTPTTEKKRKKTKEQHKAKEPVEFETPILTSTLGWYIVRQLPEREDVDQTERLQILHSRAFKLVAITLVLLNLFIWVRRQQPDLLLFVGSGCLLAEEWVFVRPKLITREVTGSDLYASIIALLIAHIYVMLWLFPYWIWILLYGFPWTWILGVIVLSVLIFFTPTLILLFGCLVTSIAHCVFFVPFKYTNGLTLVRPVTLVIVLVYRVMTEYFMA